MSAIITDWLFKYLYWNKIQLCDIFSLRVPSLTVGNGSYKIILAKEQCTSIFFYYFLTFIDPLFLCKNVVCHLRRFLFIYFWQHFITRISNKFMINTICKKCFVLMFFTWEFPTISTFFLGSCFDPSISSFDISSASIYGERFWVLITFLFSFSNFSFGCLKFRSALGYWGAVGPLSGLRDSLF